MILRGLSEALRGANGGFELNRLVGAFGGVAYIIGAHAFIGWDMWRGAAFDLTAYCLSFPGGLAVAAGGTAVAVAVKDRSVATAKATERASGDGGASVAASKVADAAVDKAEEFRS